MRNRYKNITKPLVIIAIIMLVLSVFSRSTRFSHFGNRRYMKTCNRQMENNIDAAVMEAEAYGDRAYYYVEDSTDSWSKQTEKDFEGISERIERKSEIFEEKMDRAADKFEEKIDNFFD